MDYETYESALDSHEDANAPVTYVVDRIGKLSDGQDVPLDFLSRDDVQKFCTAIGIKRNWAALTLDEIAPAGDEGVENVPQEEAVQILSALKLLIDKDLLQPEDDGQPTPTLLNDFLPEGEEFKGQKTLGHLWEFQYALAVELEHGVTRGTNVTNNHPLLTGLVVMAHLSEDSLYYARLYVMETEGELLNAQLKKESADDVLPILVKLTLAHKHLQARIDEKLKNAGAKVE